MILKYRMLSDENDNFVRDFEVPHDMTLSAFHDFIIQSLDYDDCMASFFSADDQWNKLREYTLMDMGDDPLSGAEMPLPMDSVTLATLILSGSTKLIYQFDLINERAYYLEVVSNSKPQAGMEYPRLAFENAPTPDQYDPDAVDDKAGSIFEEMMDDYGFTSEDSDSDDEW